MAPLSEFAIERRPAERHVARLAHGLQASLCRQLAWLRLVIFIIAASATTLPAASTEAPPASPADRFGALFAAVQMARIFPDGKTFVDAVPKRPDADILADWQRDKPADDAALRAFVEANFTVPDAGPPPPPSGERPPIREHIRQLWPVLTRPADQPPPGSSLLALPKPYVVPGGRFREMYYWDSYFTMLGLARDGRDDLIESMIDDFGSLIDRYGHIPNGTRAYYLSRFSKGTVIRPPVDSASKSALVESGSSFSINIAHPFMGSGSGPSETQSRSPGPSKTGMQYLFAQRYSVALRHWRTFVSPELTNFA